MVDLDRWYAFQCFMKAVNDYQMQLAILNLPAPDPNNPPELYWPCVEELTIRTPEKESSHLARLVTKIDSYYTIGGGGHPRENCFEIFLRLCFIRRPSLNKGNIFLLRKCQIRISHMFYP